MSAEDPTIELRELEAAINAPGSALPDSAVDWVDSAHETAESILGTIDSMQANGADAPTSRQRVALYNIYAAACRWLGRDPTPWQP